MLLVVIILTLLVLALTFMLMDCADAEYLTKTVVLSLMFVFGVSFSIMAMYAKNVKDIEVLKATKINVLSNYKSLAVNINKKAVVKTEGKAIIIDIVNMSQSKEASDAYTSWVNNVNHYNDKLAEEKGARASGIFSYIMYGPMPALPEDLTYIELKNLD